MNNFNTPNEIAVEFANAGIKKSKLSLTNFWIIAILGGAFIAFGALLSVMVAGGMPGIAAGNPGLVRFIAGAIFPVGLIMVSITGADLFTSDCAGLTLPLLQKRLRIATYMKLLAYSYLFNFIGTQLIAYFFSSGVGLMTVDPWKDYLHHHSAAKVYQDFFTVFVKGIGANWLVCLGVWMGYSARDIIGKCIGIWIPIMLFVTLGYEHSIANMFYIPAAIYTGADILWSEFIIGNLIPATLGNIVGGTVFVGCLYWYLYLREK